MNLIPTKSTDGVFVCVCVGVVGLVVVVVVAGNSLQAGDMILEVCCMDTPAVPDSLAHGLGGLGREWLGPGG